MDAHFALSYVTSTFGELKGRHHRLHVARTPVTAPRTSGARAVPRIYLEELSASSPRCGPGRYLYTQTATLEYALFLLHKKYAQWKQTIQRDGREGERRARHNCNWRRECNQVNSYMLQAMLWWKWRRCRDRGSGHSSFLLSLEESTQEKKGQWREFWHIQVLGLN